MAVLNNFLGIHFVPREQFDKILTAERFSKEYGGYWTKQIELGSTQLTLFCNEPPTVTAALESEHEQRGGEPILEEQSRG